MPVLMPRTEVLCQAGHKMYARTVPLVGYENMVVLGCEDDHCLFSLLTRIRLMAADEWESRSEATP